jgi:hypothetical protein
MTTATETIGLIIDRLFVAMFFAVATALLEPILPKQKPEQTEDWDNYDGDEQDAIDTNLSQDS